MSKSQDLLHFQSDFNEWLASVLPERTPDGIVAWAFNIRELCGTQGAVKIDWYGVEIVGSILSDDEPDWACNAVWDARPEEFLIAAEEFDHEWEMAQNGIEALVKTFLQQADCAGASLLRAGTAVAVGFVDGDLIRVWP